MSGPVPSYAGVKQVSVARDSYLRFTHPHIPQSLKIASGANSIKWHYALNTAVTPTIGGEVTQILSAYVGPMMITGIAPNRVELNRIKDWFVEYFELAGTVHQGAQFRDEMAVIFRYPKRGWEFYIQPTDFQGFKYDKGTYAIPWQVTAEIVSDNALNYLSGATMTAFTGPLANPAFVQVGYSDPTGTGKRSMFVNPLLGADIPTIAKSMGDNFQRLVATWLDTGFADFSLGTASNGTVNLDKAYTDLFGSPALNTGAGGGAGGGSSNADISVGGGSYVYGGPLNPTDPNNVAQDIAARFNAAGIPGRLGVAVALVESSLDPNKLQIGGGPGIGLFQVSRDGTGRGRLSLVKAAAQSLANGGKVTDAYTTDQQIADATHWFAEFNPFGGNFDPTNVDQMAQWAQAAQAAGVSYFPNGHASDKFRSLWNQAGTYLTAATVSTASGYKNPYRAVTNLRAAGLDQGVDYSGEGPVYAIGKAKITFVSTTSGWPGGGAIGYTLLEGSAAGRGVYFTENITPRVVVGQVVDSGTVICTMHNSYPYTESGWAVPGTDQPLASLNPNPHSPKSYGVNFNQMLGTLGVQPLASGTAVDGPIAAGFPRWA